MEKILTVVIPSYNVEKYLNQTLASFINDEVMDEIEILIVDDGSKDRTAEIGRRYEEKHPNTFKLISKENGGHGSAINTGIKYATGKYFKNVDGDDWVNTVDFVKLVNALKKCNSDYVFTSYTNYNNQTGEFVEINQYNFENEISFEEFCIIDNNRMQMHALTTKTSILQENKITLDEHCFYVDAEFVLLPLAHVKTVSFFNLSVYIYRLALATQSVNIENFKKNRNQHEKVIWRIINQYVLDNKYNLFSEKAQENIEEKILGFIFTQFYLYFSFDSSDKKIKKELLNFDKELKKLSPSIYKKAYRANRIKLFRLLKNIAYKPCIKLIQKKL